MYPKLTPISRVSKCLIDLLFTVTPLNNSLGLVVAAVQAMSTSFAIGEIVLATQHPNQVPVSARVIGLRGGHGVPLAKCLCGCRGDAVVEVKSSEQWTAQLCTRNVAKINTEAPRASRKRFAVARAKEGGGDSTGGSSGATTVRKQARLDSSAAAGAPPLPRGHGGTSGAPTRPRRSVRSSTGGTGATHRTACVAGTKTMVPAADKWDAAGSYVHRRVRDGGKLGSVVGEKLVEGGALVYEVEYDDGDTARLDQGRVRHVRLFGDGLKHLLCSNYCRPSYLAGARAGVFGIGG